MKEQTEIPYWIALAHLPQWGPEEINNLVVKIVHENKISLEHFFSFTEDEWKQKFQLENKQITDLQKAKAELPNTVFLAEELLSKGFEVVPINSPDYSKTLKKNLKKRAPTILYVKGNKQIMQQDSIAIVGSRDADAISLAFTDNIAKKATEQLKVVVSGFAKGVDKQALDSAIKYNGKSIIVLPQGVLTLKSGIDKYYKKIVAGNILIVSTFPCKAGWSTGLAMARNSVIYGLSNEIYIARSSASGGTWSGVIDGLEKQNRKGVIFIRKPNEGEENANELLIQKGAIPVDLHGNIIINQETKNSTFTAKIHAFIEDLCQEFGEFTKDQIIEEINKIITSLRKIEIEKSKIDQLRTLFD